MPKISAPTVAEHRTAQRAAMLEAAESILLSEGVTAVSPASVSGRAGLARSTFYEYFPSRDDLLVALARAAFETWGKEVHAAVSMEAPGIDQFRAYIAITLRLTADGRHAMATALRGVALAPKDRDAIAAMHTGLDDPLQRVLIDLGVSQPRLTAPLVHGALGSAMSMITAGRDLDAVTRATTELLLDGLVHSSLRV